jgi:LAO/AO transport system kinase
MSQINRRQPIPYYVDGILNGDRVILGRAITLAESVLESDRLLSMEIIEKVMKYTGNAIRIGITGVPGVGKSTFIESFGKYLTSLEKKLAVLTIDPSSQRTGGSILGDKTRMETLAKDPKAFIRPSASGKALGGVATNTREAMLLCEAAGYEVILVETVGVGQSEVAVRNMVDFFLLLMLAGAGDELQGIKKGIIEMADALVITKADGDNIGKVTRAQSEYQHALHLFPPTSSGWSVKVLTTSALSGAGINEIWDLILTFEQRMQANGTFQSNRAEQSKIWLKACFDQLLEKNLAENVELHQQAQMLEQEVSKQKKSVYKAAHQLMEAYREALCKSRNQNAD